MKIALTLALAGFFSAPLYADDTPARFLSEHYQPAPVGEQGAPQWQKADTPGFVYRLCLDKPLDAQQRILVMCGEGDNDHSAGADSGYFDIWYLNGDKAVSLTGEQGAGRYGQSGDVQAVRMGDRWGVVTQSGYSLQGFTQAFERYYVRLGDSIVSVATVTTYSDNLGYCEPAQDCKQDELNVNVKFGVMQPGKLLPDMKLTAKGRLEGETINKSWSLPFDEKTQRYAIPEKLNIRY
ncbi:hypothetical protein [Franconibacter helveticus]|uniref:hypothetical protein n=1 Tax=Franconibacter helveticus TaxID=357240 RepID=UPI00066C7602|nr:hypothetical protein [Franconibacter helveticus]